MGRDSGRKLEIAVWLGLVVLLLLIVAASLAAPVLVGRLYAQHSAAPLPRSAQLVVQVSDFVLTKWYLIVAAALVGSIGAAFTAWGRRGQSASS